MMVRPPHHFREYKVSLLKQQSLHRSTDRDFYDQPEELVTDYERPNTRYNVQKFDMPVLMERVDIIHEIANTNGDIQYHITEQGGFNLYDVITNDPYWGKEADVGFRMPMLPMHEKGLMIENFN